MLCQIGHYVMSKKFAGLALAPTTWDTRVERKSQWFQRRTKYSWFNRRGFLGEALLFGYPKTIEGYGVTFLMACAISIVGYVLYLI